MLFLPAAVPPPFVLTLAEKENVRRRCQFFADDVQSCIPSKVRSIQFINAFDRIGTLKSADYIIRAGPIGKYQSYGCLRTRVQERKAIFNYLDIIGLLWAKTMHVNKVIKI